MRIRELHPGERCAWLSLRERLWPDNSPEELAREQEAILADPSRHRVLVAAPDQGELAGFAEVSIREWAEGCATRPVGYLEGWFVAPEHRRRGLGGQLLAAAERWVLSRGCTEMASDADVENQVSHRAHRALGFAEIGRAVLFTKRLAP